MHFLNSFLPVCTCKINEKPILHQKLLLVQFYNTKIEKKFLNIYFMCDAYEHSWKKSYDNPLMHHIFVSCWFDSISVCIDYYCTCTHSNLNRKWQLKFMIHYIRTILFLYLKFFLLLFFQGFITLVIPTSFKCHDHNILIPHEKLLLVAVVAS